MVEYGGGINQGPAGQVGGGGGGGGNAPSIAYDDPFANVTGMFSDGIDFILAQPLEILVAGFFVALLGLVILKRAF